MSMPAPAGDITYADQLEEEARQQSVVANMAAFGQVVEEKVYADYFAQDAPMVHILPDGRSSITFRKFNEGQRRKYLNKVNRDVRVQKVTGDAIMSMKPGDERAALLEDAIVDWNLHRGGQPHQFNSKNLREFLDLADPKLIDDIEKAVKLANPWMLGDMEPEDIDREIKNLQELKAKILEEREGNGSSSSK